MAARRALLAAGSASAAAVACGSSVTNEAECEQSLSQSFDVISPEEINEVSNLVFASGGAASAPELCDIGNGWVSATKPQARAAIALGRDLAHDPRVQAAVLDRISDPRALAAPSHLLDELRLVLVSREVAADGSEGTRTSDAASKDAGVQTPSEVDSAVEAQEQDDASTDQASTAEPDTCDRADEEGETLAGVLLEAALVIASVIVITVLARRFNGKAVALAASAIAGAWGHLFSSGHK